MGERVTIAPELYGLVLGGGRSKRMGRDKGALSYHGKPQTIFAYNLLGEELKQVYVSCRKDQADEPHIAGQPLIFDRYADLGPTGGILSAFYRYPRVAWLVLACDMPFVDQWALVKLIKGRNPSKTATCFFNTERKWPEPLLAIYEPAIVGRFKHYISIGKACPRKILMNSDVEMLEPSHQRFLDNINTPEDIRTMGIGRTV